jgi:hypothetical protein
MAAINTNASHRLPFHVSGRFRSGADTDDLGNGFFTRWADRGFCRAQNPRRE